MNTATPEPLRILIVEDHDDSANSLKILLELYGHSPENASTALLAVENCRREQYDVIIIDIGLKGGVDGWDLAIQLRSDAIIPADCVLVAMTGYGREEDIQRTFASGMNYHLTKPSDPVILKTLLDEIRNQLK